MSTTATIPALTQIATSFANSLKRREASPFFPFTSVANVRAANELAGGYFFDPLAMREFGSKIESAMYAGTLFITSEKSWDGEGRHYTIRYVVPTGEVFTLGGASQLKTIDEARDIARTVAKDLRESNLLTK